MGEVGKSRYIDFRIADINGDPVAGLVLSDFTVIFTRNNASCSDVISLTDLTGGRYSATYTPSAIGYDYVEMYSTANDQRVIDTDNIFVHSIDDVFTEDSSSSVTLTETYDGGAYQITAVNPSSYTVYAFKQTDWQSGVRNPSQALGSSSVSTSGDWVGSITLPLGTYTLVAISPPAIIVLNPFLTLS